MKLTKSQLKQIIKEELSNLSEGNMEEAYCEKNPEAKGCEEYRARKKALTSLNQTPNAKNTVLPKMKRVMLLMVRSCWKTNNTPNSTTNGRKNRRSAFA